LIDEIENHLHPKLQKRLPALLSQIFPNIQFIASTHSPIPLLGVTSKPVILNVERNSNGITLSRLEQLEDYLPELLPNTIYTSDIFDLDEIISNQAESTSEVSTADNYREFELEKTLKEKLKIIEQSDDEFLNFLKNEKNR
jgi:hypothetical protein